MRNFSPLFSCIFLAISVLANFEKSYKGWSVLSLQIPDESPKSTICLDAIRQLQEVGLSKQKLLEWKGRDAHIIMIYFDLELDD